MIRSRNTIGRLGGGLLAALALLASAAVAQPVQLVSNGGFEDATDFNDWGIKRAFTGSLLVCGTSPSTAHSGSRAALFGAHEGQPDVLFKTFATDPGQSYQVTFWLASDNIAASWDGFQAIWDDQVLLNLSNPQSGFGYTQYRYVVTARGYTTRLAFQGYKRFGTFRLDDVSVTVAPATNRCQDAPTILLDGVYYGTTAGATADDPFSNPCGLLGAPDVWYRLNVPCAGMILEISTCGSSYDTVISLHEGICGPQIACNDDGGPDSPCSGTRNSYMVTFFNAPGTYSLRISGFNAFEFGNFVLRLRSELPPNDRCTNAETVTLGQTRAGTLVCAIDELQDGSLCAPISGDMWFRYSPTCDHVLRLDTCTSNVPTVLGLYDGGCEAPQLLACNADAPEDAGCSPEGTSLLEHPVYAGMSYLIRLGARPGSGIGTYRLHVLSADPTPFTCATAMEVTEGTTEFDAHCANGNGGRFCDAAAGAPGYWFRYMAMCAGDVDVSICDPDAPSGARLSVYAGSCDSLTCLDSIELSNMSVCPAETGALSFSTEAFETYYICYTPPPGGTPRRGRLNIQPVRPPGDLCADAIPIGDGTYTGSTECAVPDGVTGCGFSEMSPSVWYRWTATCNAQLTVDTCGSDYDTVLALFRGSCGDMQHIACNDDGAPCGPPFFRQSRVSIPVLAGETYLIRVGGFTTSRGNYVLNVQSTVPENTHCDAPLGIAAGVTDFDARCMTGTGGRYGDMAINGPAAWFVFVPPCDGPRRLEVCRRAGPPVALLSAYTGACGELTCIASANVSLPQFCPSSVEAFTFDAVANEPVLICYTQFPGTSLGDLRLRLVEPTAAGDHCADATPLFLGATVELVGCATPDAEIPACGIGMPGRWFAWTAPRDGRLKLDTCESRADTAIAVFEGDCALLTPIDCRNGWDLDGPCGYSDDAFVDLPVYAGFDYRIWVGASDGDEFRLNATFEAKADGAMGDLNCDGYITVGDVGPFVLAVTNPAEYAQQNPYCDPLNGDINQDGMLTVSDIGLFVTMLVQGG
jgi:hypothetical protein